MAYRVVPVRQVTAAGRRIGAAIAARAAACATGSRAQVVVHPNLAALGSREAVVRAVAPALPRGEEVSWNGGGLWDGSSAEAWDVLGLPAGAVQGGVDRLLPMPRVLVWNRNVVVVDKPPGMLSQPVRGADGNVSWEGAGSSTRGMPPPASELSLEEVVHTMSSLAYGKRSHACHLVHRIDRPTSGVVVLARKRSLLGPLQEAWSDPEVVHKSYLAVVEGIPEFDERMIRSPIMKRPGNSWTFHTSPKGKPARTLVRLLATVKEADVSIVECVLHTGRTHQARVHLSAAGHPIVGDAQYGAESSVEDVLQACAALQAAGTYAPPSPDTPSPSLPKRDSPLPWGLSPSSALHQRASALMAPATGGEGDDGPPIPLTTPHISASLALTAAGARTWFPTAQADGTLPPILLHSHAVQLACRVRGAKLNAVAPPPPAFGLVAGSSLPGRPAPEPEEEPAALEFVFT